MITIVDYGMGNLGSLANMFKRIGHTPVVTGVPEAIAEAERLVLPGVGHFDAAMRRIAEAPGLREALDHAVQTRRAPILGVCLGMQLLTEGSEEGRLPGLGWLRASTIRFPRGNGLKVPHMGWNVVEPTRGSRLTLDLGSDPRFYFVHSYYVKPTSPSTVILESTYGLRFAAAIEQDNVLGVQFHPEKSHRYGLKLLENFGSV